MWCSGRDSNPGLRLERPEYLTGLYYRSTFHAEVSCKCFSTRINLILLFIGTATLLTRVLGEFRMRCEKNTVDSMGLELSLSSLIRNKCREQEKL
jgi:hypothetical protein